MNQVDLTLPLKTGYLNKTPGSLKYRRVISRRKDGSVSYVDIEAGVRVWINHKTHLLVFEYNGKLVDKNLKPIASYRRITGVNWRDTLAFDFPAMSIEDEGVFLTNTRLAKLNLLLSDVRERD